MKPPAFSRWSFTNLVQFNNDDGIITSGASVLYNNVVRGNGATGIRSNGSASYNSSYSNGINYLFTTGNIGNISLDCLFVNEAAGDFRLQPASPCKDTGNPGFQDVDGTISDMGIYGGPASALFWPYGNGGPVVTNLVVDPPIVPEGGALSIRATVEIR